LYRAIQLDIALLFAASATVAHFEPPPRLILVIIETAVGELCNSALTGSTSIIEVHDVVQLKATSFLFNQC